jgi:hypothetical protein
LTVEFGFLVDFPMAKVWLKGSTARAAALAVVPRNCLLENVESLISVKLRDFTQVFLFLLSVKIYP